MKNEECVEPIILYYYTLGKLSFESCVFLIILFINSIKIIRLSTTLKEFFQLCHKKVSLTSDPL